MVIIPARIGSTRFPKKVLYPIEGIPMVIRVAQQAKELDEVVIATDSQEVVEVAKKFNFKALLTNSKHKSGTDRVNEAVAILGLGEEEIVVNVQADEPFIEPHLIKEVKELAQKHLNDPLVMLNSLYKKVSLKKVKDDPNRVKVVVDKASFALYFSRSAIPYPKEIKTLNLHLGIYAYSVKMLKRFCALEVAPLEKIEKLEQLRALYHGYKVALQEVVSNSIGIDTKDDLELLKKLK